MSDIVNGRTRLTRQEKQAQTQARLLRSAAEVFIERGFHGASVEEIAERAGYSRGAFYSNFASKDDLLVALLDQRLQAQIDAVTHVFRSSPSMADALVALRDQGRDDSEVWSMLATEFWLYAMRQPEMRPRLAELNRIERDGYVRAIEAQFAELGAAPPAPVEDLATIVQALDHHLPKMRAIDPDGVRDGFYFEAMDLLLRAGVALSRQSDGR